MKLNDQTLKHPRECHGVGHAIVRKGIKRSIVSNREFCDKNSEISLEFIFIFHTAHAMQ